MKRVSLSLPEVAIVSGTRAALGAGVALLLADRLNDDQRRGVGWALVAVGAVTTVPILVQMLKSRQSSSQCPEERKERGIRRYPARELG